MVVGVALALALGGCGSGKTEGSPDGGRGRAATGGATGKGGGGGAAGSGGAGTGGDAAGGGSAGARGNGGGSGTVGVGVGGNVAGGGSTGAGGNAGANGGGGAGGNGGGGAKAGADGNGGGGGRGAAGAGGNAGGGGRGAAGAGGNAGGSTCGDGVCDYLTDHTLTCPQDCAVKRTDVAVDLKSTLMWELGLSSFLSWDDANTYCGTLTLDGYTGTWHLPAIEDQEDLLGTCVDNEITGDTTCPICAQSPVCSAWFSTDELDTWDSYQYGTCCAGAVNFMTGAVDFTLYKSNAIRARCVRTATACSAGCAATETCVQGLCVPVN